MRQPIEELNAYLEKWQQMRWFSAAAAVFITGASSSAGVALMKSDALGNGALQNVVLSSILLMCASGVALFGYTVRNWRGSLIARAIMQLHEQNKAPW